MILYDEKVVNVGSVVGSKTENVNWIQGAVISILCTWVSDQRLLTRSSWQIRGCSGGGHAADLENSSKTKPERDTEDGSPYSVASMKREQTI